jgi:hypothetical protein
VLTREMGALCKAAGVTGGCRACESVAARAFRVGSSALRKSTHAPRAELSIRSTPKEQI